MDITAAVLAASMMFGVSYADMDIESEVYDTIKIPVHAVDWSDGTEKLSGLSYTGGKITSGKAQVNSARIYSVGFPVGSSVPTGTGVEIVKIALPKRLTLGVTGYASPDGSIPEMQYNLAKRRMKRIKQELEGSGFRVLDKGAIVCDKDVTRSDCWRADITIEGNGYE